MLQPINSPEISHDLKIEDNNPPENLTCNSINISIEHQISTKTLDVYEDPHLLHFLKYGTYLPGASNKQNKRVHGAAIHYKCYNNQIYYSKNPQLKSFDLIVPPIADRQAIIERAHDYGHFKLEATCT